MRVDNVAAPLRFEAMIQRLLWHIAGLTATLATCPVTDKVWAAHLGFSLVLSFTVVLGNATWLIIANPCVRLAAATVALTVFMFDRAPTNRTGSTKAQRGLDRPALTIARTGGARCGASSGSPSG